MSGKPGVKWHVSSRTNIIETLKAYSDGLNCAKLAEIVQAQYSVGKGQLASVLCQMVAEGIITRTGRKPCPHCGVKAVYYKARK